MSTTYVPLAGVFPGRPPCAACGANFQLHEPPADLLANGFVITGRGLGALYQRGVRLSCPTAYRPDTVEVAQRELEHAVASGDANRIFVARGNLQRLEGPREIVRK